MASGSWQFGTSNGNIQGEVRWQSISNGSVANSSNVTVSVYFRRTNYGYHSYGIINTGVQCDDKTYWENNFHVDIYNDWVLVNARTYSVQHGSDGTKKCYIRAVGSADFGLSFDTSTYVNLDTIPRYTSISSFNNILVTQTSATFSWNTSDDIDYIKISLNDGDFVDAPNQNGEAKTGTFRCEGLEPNKTYNIRIQVRRLDSQLWTTSNNIQFTTSPIATINNSSIDFNIGSNITINFVDYTNNKSYLKLDVMKVDGEWERDIVSVDETLQVESYTWNLSNYASMLYSKVSTRNSAKVRIRCGTTINGKVYENAPVQGVMTVINSNPSFSNYTYGDADSSIQSVIGNSSYMLQGYGDMQAHISTANKAVAKNSAIISYYVGEIYNSLNQVVAKIQKNYSASSQVDFSFGNINSNGTYTLKIYAIDSRNNKSPVVSKTIYVLPYHLPLESIKFHRLNDYEQNMQIDLSVLYSKVTVDTVNKNSLTVTYRYKLSTSNSWSSIYSIPVSSSSYNNTDFKATYVNNNFEIGGIINLDINSTYDFIFYITDKFKTKQISIIISQGIPLMFIGDDGHITIGKLPTVSNKNKLQVASDIMCKDTDNQYVNVMEEMRKIFVIGNTEPSNQKIGGLWFHEHDSKKHIGDICVQIEKGVYEKLCQYASNIYLKDGITTLQDKIDEVADFVIAQGTSGIWAYRKWNSGIAEAWGISTGTTDSGGIYHASLSHPFPYAENPVIAATAYVAGDYTARVGYVGTTTTDMEFYVHGFANNSACARLYVIGRWK